MLKPILTIAVFAFLSSACTQTGAKAVADADALHERAREYVREIHDKRKEIRRMCWEMLMQDLARLEREGNTSQARVLLRNNYPPLVTVKIILELLTDPEGFSSKPAGCYFSQAA